MTTPVFQLTFPPVTLFDWIIVSLAGLALLSWLVFISFPEKEQSRLAERLPRPAWLWVLVGAVFSTAVFAVAFRGGRLAMESHQ